MARHRRLGIGALLGTVAGLSVGLSLPRHYTTEVSFVPESRGVGLPVNGLAGGLAGQLGLNLGADGASSPRFYVELLASRAVLDQVLHAPVRESELSARRPLLDILAPDEANGARRADLAMRKLRKMLSTRIQPEPRIVYLTVTGSSPALVADVAQGAIAALRRFDVEMRQTEAKDRRIFLEQRVSEARATLDQAERAMASFLETNRFIDAPRLRYEQGRLQRDIDLRNQLYMNLAGQLETARIDEVNERPRITIIDRAAEPVRPVPRLLPIFLLSGLMLGAAIAAIPLFWKSLSAPLAGTVSAGARES